MDSAKLNTSRLWGSEVKNSNSTGNIPRTTIYGAANIDLSVIS